VIAVVQFGSQIYLKENKGNLEFLFLHAQIVIFETMYQANLPANIIIYLDEYRKMINMEMLNADFFLKFVDKDLTVLSITEKILGRHLVMTKNLENTGMVSGNMLVNLIPLITIILAVLIPYSFLWLGSKIAPLCIRDKFQKKLEATNKA
jgi:uncharacterized membrane protein